MSEIEKLLRKAYGFVEASEWYEFIGCFTEDATFFSSTNGIEGREEFLNRLLAYDTFLVTEMELSDIVVHDPTTIRCRVQITTTTRASYSFLATHIATHTATGWKFVFRHFSFVPDMPTDIPALLNELYALTKRGSGLDMQNSPNTAIAQGKIIAAALNKKGTFWECTILTVDYAKLWHEIPVKIYKQKSLVEGVSAIFYSHLTSKRKGGQDITCFVVEKIERIDEPENSVV